MGDPNGFLTIHRQEGGYRPVEERINDFNEVEVQLPDDARRQQAGRCMECGVPFCHWACPVSNEMPEWQDFIYRGKWREAWEILQATNNFPEFTGRVCPALCEASCVLALNDDAVTIRQNELAVIEHAFREGYVQPRLPETRSGKKVAVIGGGPAGLACADMLNQQGHSVTLYEAADAVGGYLRFGIPDFKLDKKIIDRRINIMEQEGITFTTGTSIGRDISTDEITSEYDAVALTIGARKPRDLPAEGRELKGIHFAMEYLEQQNLIVRGDAIPDDDLIKALNTHVVVIGGGDTGSDCVGTANRQGAASITQLELLPQPPAHRSEDQPWPLWPKLHKTSSSHEEGCERLWNVRTLRFNGEDGKISSVDAIKVQWSTDENGKKTMKDIPGSEFTLKADLVFLAMGFVHPEHEGPIHDMQLKIDARGNIEVDTRYMTSKDGIFAGGDARRGASLVVYAIEEGREMAEAIDSYLS